MENVFFAFFVLYSVCVHPWKVHFWGPSTKIKSVLPNQELLGTGTLCAVDANISPGHAQATVFA